MTVVGVLSVEIFIPASRSLKDKRMILNSIKDRLHKKFNVSVAETGFQEKWQRAEISVAAISDSHKHIEEVLNKIFQLLDADVGYEITKYNFDYR
jgi:uncharacterized protein YlxP (DUF503 family)